MENTDSVLEFLTSQQSMDNPDRIEEVNEKILKKLVAETNFVAVLFCKWTSASFLLGLYVVCSIFCDVLSKIHTEPEKKSANSLSLYLKPKPCDSILY